MAFISGFITFFASCLLPLVPTYIAYLSGITLSAEKAEEPSLSQRWKLISVAALFVAGFVLTFIVLGATMQRFALVLAPYRLLFTRISGLLFIVLGLFMLGLFQHSFLSKEYRLPVTRWFTKKTNIHAFLTGIAFGFGWTPCIGPVLATILFWSAQQNSYMLGISMLAVYGLGLGIPFLLVAAFFNQIVPFLKKSRAVSLWVSRLSGVVMILAGVGLFTNSMQAYAFWLLSTLQLDRFAQ